MNNQFVSKTLAVAVAMACAGNVSALTLASFNEADTANQLTLRISGSSAHDKGLMQLLRLTTAGGAEICAPNTLDVYTSGTSDTTLRCGYTVSRLSTHPSSSSSSSE